jgi:hypothetical protein
MTLKNEILSIDYTWTESFYCGLAQQPLMPLVSLLQIMYFIKKNYDSILIKMNTQKS